MKNKILITSALPYVNYPLHIGHLVGCLLPSDVYARFCRAKYGNDNVLFVCGADEHGTPIIVGAKKENMNLDDYADKYRAIHEKSVADFNLSFDGGYGRTHTELQTQLVQSLFTKLDANGFIEERTTLQPFSVDDNMFLADRQIEGTCPKCGFEHARGDQCDKCGELLDPVDLINPYVADTGSKNIEMKETKNLFYLAHRVKGQVADWFKSTAELNGWSPSAISTTKKYLGEDIPDLCVTRDLSWGIPVNKPGFENKVFYVWFDAPWGYVSISQAANKNWADWWKNPESKYVQFMGKDNIKFHSIYFPGQMIALNDNWKTVDILKGLNFLNFEGAKISKSTGNGIFLTDAINDAPADSWRYALMSSAPETDDTDFTIQRFADIVNKDLNGILGNFVSRVTKLTEKNFGLTVPASKNGFETQVDKINEYLNELNESLEKCEFRRAVFALRSIWGIANEYMTEFAPWAFIKEGKMDEAGAVLNECFQLIEFYARISAPFIPTTAEKIQNIFETKHDLSWPTEYERRITDGTEFRIPENLFERIDDDKINLMKQKYIKSEPKIVIAKIMTANPHPDSDHLQVLTVDDGKTNDLQIVCGAPNARAGLISVLARVGAQLPGFDKPLEKRKVRGVVSNGMMCASDELGIGTEHDGIIELPDDSVIGAEFKK